MKIPVIKIDEQRQIPVHAIQMVVVLDRQCSIYLIGDSMPINLTEKAKYSFLEKWYKIVEVLE